MTDHVCIGGSWDNDKKRFVCEHEVMTVSNRKSVEQILLTFQRKAFAAQSELDVIDDRHKALAALEEIMIAAKPESLADILQDGSYYPFGAGYNAGLVDFEQNIRQAFSNGGGDE